VGVPFAGAVLHIIKVEARSGFLCRVIVAVVEGYAELGTESEVQRGYRRPLQGGRTRSWAGVRLGRVD
jgi:hypothetical protein